MPMATAAKARPMKVMAAVFRFAADVYEYQHYGVCRQVGERVDGVGGHGSAMTHYASDKLEHRKHYVRSTSDDC